MGLFYTPFRPHQTALNRFKPLLNSIAKRKAFCLPVMGQIESIVVEIQIVAVEIQTVMVQMRNRFDTICSDLLHFPMRSERGITEQARNVSSSFNKMLSCGLFCKGKKDLPHSLAVGLLPVLYLSQTRQQNGTSKKAECTF